MHGGRCAASAATRPAERLQPTPRAHMRGSSHGFLTAARRLTLRSRLARAGGVGSAASAQGAQTQQSSPKDLDQQSSPAQFDAVYKERFITAADMSQSVVLPSVSPAQAASGCLHPSCAKPFWMPIMLLRTPFCQFKHSDALHWTECCACPVVMAFDPGRLAQTKHLTGASTSAAACLRCRAPCNDAGSR